ncbi:hypothetical protein [Hymenobacter gummosus]|nr:hypothetical protein [Hymenobacter gummosus]
MLADVSLGLTKAAALTAPKLFQLRRTLGEREVTKLVVVVLRAFVDSVRAEHKPDAADLMEAADYLVQTYTHDSLKDLVLALKEARTSGKLKAYYNTLDMAVVYAALTDYFERKADYLNQQHLDQKAQGATNQNQALQQLQQAAPQLMAGIGRQIPDDHPNAAHLRHRLTVIGQKEKRGLITPEQAQQLRDETTAATIRQPRQDWKPGEEAQRAIDQRHWASTRRFAERHGINPNCL